MQKNQPLPIAASFPVGGLHKGTSLQGQPENTTASALNVWPQDWGGGRARGGSRPGLTSEGLAVGIPYHWSVAEWILASDNTVHAGIAIASSSGLWIAEGGSEATAVSESLKIATPSPVTSAKSSCTVYQQRAYLADQAAGTIKFYDLNAASGSDLTAVEAAGSTAPTYCGLVAVMGDRLVVSGDKVSPHALYMPRIGDHTDWDYTKTDGSAAWANAGAVPGKLGEVVTTLYTHNRNCLLVGCTDSLYVVRGNPAAGAASVELLSRQVSPLMMSAICKTGSEHTVFMSRHGLYRMDPGCGEPPVNMSDDKLPDELSDFDPDEDTVSLAYDAKFRGIHILINRQSAPAPASAAETDFPSAYFYSIIHDSYWPMDFATSLLYFGAELKSYANNDRSGVLIMKSGSGWVFDATDTSESFISRCLFGPFALGTALTEGVLSELASVMSSTSGDAEWEVYAAGSPQEAFDLAETGSSPSFTGSDWTIAGLNYTQRPRVRGTVCYILVKASGGDRWSLEEMFGIAYSNAKRRVR
jgi:hypothetical protein